MTLSGLKLYLLEEMMAELFEPGIAPLLTGVTVGVAPPSPPPGPWAGHGVTTPGTRDESEPELQTKAMRRFAKISQSLRRRYPLTHGN